MNTKYGLLTTHAAATKGYIPATVLLDGHPMKDVAVVNDIEGWIEVYRKDAHGHHVIINEIIKTDRLYGEVEYIPNGGCRV